MRTINLIGRRYGKLLVISRATPALSKFQGRAWSCRCDCGKTVVRETSDLNSRSRHCGCVRIKSGSENKSWLGSGGVSGSILCMIRKSAAKRGLSFGLSCKYLWALFQDQKGICAISGVPIHLRKISQQRKNYMDSASLDRIDSSAGYVVGNVQWTSLAVNLMKRNLSHSDFINLCRKIAKHQNKAMKTIATIVGERPATVPENVGVFVVEGGKLK